MQELTVPIGSMEVEITGLSAQIHLPSVPHPTKIFIADKELNLSPQQHKLLLTMLMRPGRIFSKQELISTVTERAEYKLIDVLICRLRQTLRDAFRDDDAPIQINSHWGLGTSITYGPYDAPNSGIRWTPLKKQAFLKALAAHDPESNSDGYANFRSQYPEITDEMITYWQSGFISETKDFTAAP